MGVLPFETEDEARREERRIHDHFGGFRARGEWFYATPRIIQYIEDYPVQIPGSSTPDQGGINPDVQPTRSEEAIAFGQWLQECRERNNMTPDDVAKSIGCTKGYIRHIQNGWGMPGRRLREALIALFGDPADSTTEETIPNNPISVKMSDGTWISENTGIDTFIEVIKTIGIEEVKKFDLPVNGIPLISDCDYDGKAQRKVETETVTYWIVSGTDTERKKRILDGIADRLNVNMTVFANTISK